MARKGEKQSISRLIKSDTRQVRTIICLPVNREEHNVCGRATPLQQEGLDPHLGSASLRLWVSHFVSLNLHRLHLYKMGISKRSLVMALTSWEKACAMLGGSQSRESARQVLDLPWAACNCACFLLFPLVGLVSALIIWVSSWKFHIWTLWPWVRLLNFSKA